jgi:hypothetical protein
VCRMLNFYKVSYDVLAHNLLCCLNPLQFLLFPLCVSSHDKISATLGGETSPPDQEVLLPHIWLFSESKEAVGHEDQLRTKHERKPQRVEIILENCHSVVKENGLH